MKPTQREFQLARIIDASLCANVPMDPCMSPTGRRTEVVKQLAHFLCQYRVELRLEALDARKEGGRG